MLYDDNGKMEGGYFDVIDLNGQDKVPFKVYAIDAPEYKDYKVFVSPFSFDYSDEEDVQTVQ